MIIRKTVEKFHNFTIKPIHSFLIELSTLCNGEGLYEIRIDTNFSSRNNDAPSIIFVNMTGNILKVHLMVHGDNIMGLGVSYKVNDSSDPFVNLDYEFKKHIPNEPITHAVRFYKNCLKPFISNALKVDDYKFEQDTIKWILDIVSPKEELSPPQHTKPIMNPKMFLAELENKALKDYSVFHPPCHIEEYPSDTEIVFRNKSDIIVLKLWNDGTMSIRTEDNGRGTSLSENYLIDVDSFYEFNYKPFYFLKDQNKSGRTPVKLSRLKAGDYFYKDEKSTEKYMKIETEEYIRADCIRISDGNLCELEDENVMIRTVWIEKKTNKTPVKLSELKSGNIFYWDETSTQKFMKIGKEPYAIDDSSKTVDFVFCELDAENVINNRTVWIEENN
jgi:hypothetical protein